MADDVHIHQQPAGGSDGGGGGAGWFVAGLVVVMLVVVLWFAFGRGGSDTTIPDEIDVEINLPDQGG